MKKYNIWIGALCCLLSLSLACEDKAEEPAAKDEAAPTEPATEEDETEQAQAAAKEGQGGCDGIEVPGLTKERYVPEKSAQLLTFARIEGAEYRTKADPTSANAVLFGQATQDSGGGGTHSFMITHKQMVVPDLMTLEDDAVDKYFKNLEKSQFSGEGGEVLSRDPIELGEREAPAMSYFDGDDEARLVVAVPVEGVERHQIVQLHLQARLNGSCPSGVKKLASALFATAKLHEGSTYGELDAVKKMKE